MAARSLLLFLFSVALLVGTNASAHKNGISGHSGKQGVDCGDCHTCTVKSACSTPAVSFTGPLTLAPGETGLFTFNIAGGPGQQFHSDAGAVGFNVAASEGTLAPVEGDSSVQVLADEVTHTAPKPYGTELKQSFTFNFTAGDAGMVTLFGAGNSVNGNGMNTGDRWGTNTWVITVEVPDAGVDAGTPTVDAGVDAGTSPGTDGGAGDEVTKAGCGCQDGGGGDMPLALGSLLALALWSRRR